MTGLFNANMEKLGAATIDRDKKNNILTKKNKNKNTKILKVMSQVNKNTTPVRRTLKEKRTRWNWRFEGDRKIT